MLKQHTFLIIRSVGQKSRQDQMNSLLKDLQGGDQGFPQSGLLSGGSKK